MQNIFCHFSDTNDGDIDKTIVNAEDATQCNLALTAVELWLIVHTVKPRYNAVSGRHLLRPRYKRGAL